MIDDICSRHWDAIVIGTGIGGGTIGRRLAEKGLSVLFVEKGSAGQRDAENALDAEGLTDPAARLQRGAWPDPVRARIEGRERSFYASIGAGVGGSSVFYAATLERPEPHDLDDSQQYPHPTGGWPVRFAEMLPYFDAAQDLYHIQGEQDPLASHPSPQLRPADPLPDGPALIAARITAAGLHPYQLHSAVRHLDGCQSCLGRKCPRACKMDGRSAGVEPALATGRATLLDNCEVTGLGGEPDRITHVLAQRGDQSITLHARHVILAAGALSSPRLLMESRSPHWPDGCGNGHDQVGRNLIFHLNEVFALWPRRGEGFPDAVRSIGFRDLYFVNGKRLGMVQAMGLNAGMGDILHYLRMRLARSPLRGLPGRRLITRAIAMITAWSLGQAKMFVGILEDLPYPENRVQPDPERPGGILIDYRFAPELLARRQYLRKLIRQRLTGIRTLFLTYEPELNFGHPCGTLRMGLAPETSVTDRDCRVHGMVNLWVADASVMPTSMGVNPSLTIAANALRVGDVIAAMARDGAAADMIAPVKAG